MIENSISRYEKILHFSEPFLEIVPSLEDGYSVSALLFMNNDSV